MDFAALLPEVNSGRMYAGPGSVPMMAAAAAWDGLAADLYATATSYQSVVSGLTSGPWLGPASASMAAAAATYVAWLNTTAAQAEQAGAQAKAAAAAYETAFMMTVPPPVIAANRALLMSLIATNFFGQNTPAIAATETRYAEMWAQDAAAMYGYAGASAAASTLTSFTPPAPTTNPGGRASQFDAIAQTVASAFANNAAQPFSTLYQLVSAVPAALQGLASPTQSLSDVTSLLSIVTLPLLAARIATTPLTYLAAAVGGRNVGNILEGLGRLPMVLGKGGLGSIVGGLSPGLASPPVSAGLGQADSIGGLSVPPSWAATAPAARLAAAASPETNASAAPSATVGVPGGAFGQSLLGTLAGRAVGGAASKVRASVVPRMPAAG